MQVVLRAWSKLTGKNPKALSAATIVDQLNEPRPLPMGVTEFHEWADRQISGALVSADVDSQKFTLANLLLHLGPTESHKPDAFFIHSLRKFAVNQVADEIRKQLHNAAKERTAAEEAKLKVVGAPDA